ncbi:hypothetical protein EHW99_3667 [Erwinia amylovora]|uniref:Uncharacterized protein n=2 Tax=Erwinia amylovora TaxID=552 RepID=A0A831ELU7_ERWAM|nr:hypothetical protein EaACW_3747 [Erwinia amylovora ACW56400]QJQ56366.1 hypothetical protein EHX00_3667 [Erwinia amylovora]CBA24216.1 hypothetical protein predicted by Glimmer/Critica [Erwinia amylovora CFBP1430]CCO80580.1 hypothetical protein BN432_3813 [Erwinia amylovora Ea356]CCO84394.1 hypothetical protein BN433_3850 [Erwinia amylovora Ea266]CCO88146.1 hypothetical protein BN434_3789 [Erwinia amylovora CFBP 2585]CCO91939.1 hypothetical protein BN435_3799 [Erwinia amylovora 01SFR-BO]CCO
MQKASQETDWLFLWLLPAEFPAIATMIATGGCAKMSA